ncbi:hypothetical protein HID58_087213, partial [Brassica napus]
AENTDTPINLAHNTYWNLAVATHEKLGVRISSVWINTQFLHARFCWEWELLSEEWIVESIGEVGIRYDNNYALDCPD